MIIVILIPPLCGGRRIYVNAASSISDASVS